MDSIVDATKTAANQMRGQTTIFFSTRSSFPYGERVVRGQAQQTTSTFKNFLLDLGVGAGLPTV
jgi:hypothetical protein